MNLTMRNKCRGLTLIEVLISTALLGVLAAACVPILQGALSVLQNENEDFGHHVAELSVVVDRLLEDPEQFGLTFEQINQANDIFDVHWPDDPDRPAMQALVARSGDPEVLHAYLILSMVDSTGNTWSVSRLFELQEEHASP